MAIASEEMMQDSDTSLEGSPAKLVVSAEEVFGHAAGTAALLSAAGRANKREASAAVRLMLKVPDWEALAATLVPVEDPQLRAEIQESGAEIFEGDTDNPDTAGKIFVRAYDLPIWSETINKDSSLYPVPLNEFTAAAPHITDPKGQSIKQLQEAEDKRAKEAGEQPRVIVPVTIIRGGTLEEAQKLEDEAARAEGRPARLFVQKHHIARVIKTIRGYLNSDTILNQAEAEYGEWARLAQEDPSIAAEFGALLNRFANGGQSGLRVLGKLTSKKTMVDTINRLLSAPDAGVKHTDIRSYLEDAKEASGAGRSS
jgi:hypothetical protein